MEQIFDAFDLLAIVSMFKGLMDLLFAIPNEFDIGLRKVAAD